MPPWVWMFSFDGEVVGLGRRDPRRRRGQRQLGAAVGQHPGAVVGVGARQLELDVQSASLCLIAWYEPMARPKA